MAAAYICGVLLYFRPREIWAALLLMTGGSVVLVLAAHRKKKKASVMAVLAAVLFLTAFIRCGVQEQKYEKCLENAGSRTEMELTGIVFKKEIKTNSYLYYLKTSNFKNSEDFRENENIGKVLVYGSEDVASIGSEIEVSGQLEQFPHASNEGNFWRTIIKVRTSLCGCLQRTSKSGRSPDGISEKCCIRFKNGFPRFTKRN